MNSHIPVCHRLHYCYCRNRDNTVRLPVHRTSHILHSAALPAGKSPRPAQGEDINKAEYASSIHSYDRQKLEELKETQQEIEDLKQTLETEQANLEEQQAEYQAEEESVNAELEAKRSEIENFDEQIQAAAEAAAQEAAQREAAEAAADSDSSSDGTSAAEDGQSTAESSGGTSSGGSGSSDSGSSGGNSSSGGGSSNDSSSSDDSSSGGSSSGTSSGDTSVAQAIVNAAYSQLGVPYVYGGTTPGVGLDCSGLVQYCHAVAGISLPRTSAAQGGSGVAVSDPQPGDIVCYSGHVGIYIGNGQMIHAPQTGDVVKIADVYGSPWYRRCW